MATLVLALVACGVGSVDNGAGGGNAPDATPVDCNLGAQTAAVTAGGGTLQTGFLELSDGADMEATLGPQGLYMVTPAVRTQGIYPGRSGSVGDANDPMVAIAIFKDSEQVGGSAQSRIGMTPSAGGAVLLQIFSPFTVDLAEVDGVLVTIVATVSDVCGHTVTDSLDVVARQQ